MKRKTTGKTHFQLTSGLGICGYHGKTVKMKSGVTCKLCKKILKSKRA